MKSDRIMPRGNDRYDRKFYTASGLLTRYALACGYMEIRGDSESGVRIEQISSNGTIRVSGSGRWIRGENESYHVTLKDARRAFLAFDHVGISAAIALTHTASMKTVKGN